MAITTATAIGKAFGETYDLLMNKFDYEQVYGSKDNANHQDQHDKASKQKIKITGTQSGTGGSGDNNCMNNSEKYNLIYDLEMSLLTYNVRQDPNKLELLLDDDFIEFGSSGKIYNKNDILKNLPLDTPEEYSWECSNKHTRQVKKELRKARKEKMAGISSFKL